MAQKTANILDVIYGNDNYPLFDIVTARAHLVAYLIFNRPYIEKNIQSILSMEKMPSLELKKWEKLKGIYDDHGKITINDIRGIFGVFTTVHKTYLEIKVDSNSLALDEEIDLYRKDCQKLFYTNEIHKYYANLSRNKVDETCIENIKKHILQKDNDLIIIEPILDKLESLYNNEKGKSKISTCIEKIDEITRYRKGTVNTVMAYTGSYKTVYCTNVAYKAMQDGMNVCYVSLEISKEDMYYNFLSRYSNEEKFERKISHSTMKTRDLEETDKAYLFNQILPNFKKEFNDNLVIVDEDDFNSNSTTAFDSIFNKVESAFIKTNGKGIDVVIIDHLNLLKFNNDKAMLNDYAKINHWMAYFRKNCKNFVEKHKQICIIVAVQCSREAYMRAKSNGGIYSLTGAAEGNEIERSSEVVIAIYTDSDLKNEHRAKIQLIKGRNSGEMSEPTLIRVEPKYYYVENCKNNNVANDSEIVDISKNNIGVSQNNLYDHLGISQEALEILNKQNINISEFSSINQ